MALGCVGVEGFPESESFRESEALHRGGWASCRLRGRGGFIYGEKVSGKIEEGHPRNFRNRKLRWGDGKKMGRISQTSPRRERGRVERKKNRR